MAQEYTIKQVSQQEPKRYEGKFGVTLYHKVRFEGSDDIIEIGRKEGNAPKVGDKLYGTIEENEYGKKFKAEKNPNGYSGGSKYTRDDEAIQAQFAIKASIELLGSKASLKDVEDTANELFLMIGRVKKAKPSLKEQWNDTLAKKDTPPIEAYKDEVIEEVEDEINLDDIPF